MSNPHFNVFDVINALEETIKSFHCVTGLIGASSEKNHIDLDNLFYLLNGIGNNLQSQFTDLEKAAKSSMLNR